MHKCAHCPVDDPLGCPAVYLGHGRYCELTSLQNTDRQMRKAYIDLVRNRAEDDRRSHADAPPPRRVDRLALESPSRFGPDGWIAPTGRIAEENRRSGWNFRGYAPKKPWEYDTTAVVLTLDTPEDQLRTVLDLLRYSSERPYLMVIDTGSGDRARGVLDRICGESTDIEFHSLRSRGRRFSSQACAEAMDLAFAVCQTKYLYATHDDLFIKSRQLISWQRARCDDKTPAVGWRMSPRPHWDEISPYCAGLWNKMLSHTSTIYYMPRMRQIGATWNFDWVIEHYRNQYGLELDPQRGFPDTEVPIGLSLLYTDHSFQTIDDTEPLPGNGRRILCLGDETNDIQETAVWTHVRSSTSLKMYHRQKYAEYRTNRLEIEIGKGMHRVSTWKKLDQKYPTKKVGGCGCNHGLA